MYMYMYMYIVHVYQNLFQVPVEVYAQYCHKKVEKMTMTGAKKGLRKPTLEEIVQAKVHVYKKSILLRNVINVLGQNMYFGLQLLWLL